MEINQILKETFNFDQLKPGQKEVIDIIMQGRSALAIFPTGGGKSLCFQLPAICLPGLTLVISPLLALMKDQVDFLKAKGVAAARWDSTMSLDDTKKIKNDIRSNTLKILYISPERLSNEFFYSFIQNVTISLLVVDEAHCISEWGHSFRPEYLKIKYQAKQLSIKRFLCLTATATPQVANEIKQAFGIGESDFVLTGFYRSNLTIKQTVVNSDEQRDHDLIKKIKSNKQGGTIIYVTIRKKAEAICQLLNDHDIPAKYYHAGVKNDEREKVQQWFMSEKNAIVVATIAFGMGIDKSDIRYVYHYNLPKNLEGYSQEIGRAGRDGQPATCEMLALAQDGVLLESFVMADTPDYDDIRKVIAYIFQQEGDFDLALYEIANKYDIRLPALETLLVYLELGHWIKFKKNYFARLQFKYLVDSVEIFNQFNEQRADFLKRLFNATDKKKIWSYLSTDAVALQINEPVDRIIKALDYLNDQGLIELKTTKATRIYQVLKYPENMDLLIEEMHQKFQDQEKRDVDRIKQIFAYVGFEGCKNRFILDYFGEQKNQNCGHCEFCLSGSVGSFKQPSKGELTIAQKSLIDKAKILSKSYTFSKRNLARLLVGVYTPATRFFRKEHPTLYGSLEEVSFQLVKSYIDN